MEDRASVRGIPPTAGWAPSQGVGTGPTRGGKRPTSVRPVPLRALPEPFLLSRTRQCTQGEQTPCFADTTLTLTRNGLTDKAANAH